MRSFRSKAALATHFFQMHGRVACFRHFAFGDTCRACGRHFRGLQQLALHLRASEKCCDAMSASGLWIDEVLPGIGSAVWLEACRKDLGLTLPSEPTQSVQTYAGADFAWEENSVLMSAFLSGAETLLELSDVDSAAAFQFCLDITHFPLFPEEIDSIARKLHTVLEASGVTCSVDLCETARAFFADSREQAQYERLNEEVLENVFWRLPGAIRPETSGVWLVISDPDEGLAKVALGCPRVALAENWHGGDWPPGHAVLASGRGMLHSKSALFLRRLLEVLTSCWGWLWAHSSFWDSSLAIPFVRFHPVQVNSTVPQMNIPHIHPKRCLGIPAYRHQKTI